MEDAKTYEENLILNNRRLIYKVIKDMHCYWRTEDEWQDLYDAGLEGLIRGAKKYDGSTSPGTYFYTCIKNMIVRHLYISTMDKRKIHKEIMLSLSKEVSSDVETTYLDFVEDPNTNIEEDLLKKLDMEELYDVIDKILTPLQRKYLYHRYGLKGYKRMTSRELAKINNCSHENVNNSVRHGIDKLKKYFKKMKED